MFRKCKDIIARRFHQPAKAALAGLDCNISEILEEQKLDKQIVYSLLGSLLSSLRDHLDALKQQKEHGRYVMHSNLSKEIASSVTEEIGPFLANERTIPQLRLLAGVVEAKPAVHDVA